MIGPTRGFGSPAGLQQDTFLDEFFVLFAFALATGTPACLAVIQATPATTLKKNIFYWIACTEDPFYQISDEIHTILQRCIETIGQFWWYR